MNWIRKQKVNVLKERLKSAARNKYLWAIAGIVLLAIVATGITGYTTYISGVRLEVEEKLAACNQTLTSTQQQFAACKSDLATTQDEYSKCTDEKAALQSAKTTLEDENQKLIEENKDLTNQLGTCQSDVATLTAAKTTAEINYEQLASNAAQNICCKRKVDNPNLKYFYVADNTIHCTENADAAPDTKEFSCFA